MESKIWSEGFIVQNFDATKFVRYEVSAEFRLPTMRFDSVLETGTGVALWVQSGTEGPSRGRMMQSGPSFRSWLRIILSLLPRCRDSVVLVVHCLGAAPALSYAGQHSLERAC